MINSPFLESIKDELKNLKATIEEKDALIFELLKDYYKEEPVTIQEFLENPYYLGDVGKTLFPIWREKLPLIYPSRFLSPYHLVILQASIGSGKSFLMGVCGCYELHKLLCLKNPSAFYGLSPADVLYFLFYTPKRAIGMDGNYLQFKNLLSGSEYFREHVNIPETGCYGQLTPNIACRVVSLSNDLVSKAVIYSTLDEFNERKNKQLNNMHIYDEMMRRMQSRLLDSSGHQPYKLVVGSSPKDESDELGKVIDNIKNYNIKNCLIIDNITAMDTSGTRLNYCGKKFQVYIDGDNSYVMDSPEDIRVAEFNPECIYDVPVEYQETFKLDCIGSIRDILGIRIGSIDTFFRNPKVIDECFSRENPIGSDTLILPFNIGYEEGVDFLFNKLKHNWIYPDCPRCIHLDTAISGDRLGIGSSFITPIQETDFNMSISTDTVLKNAMFINDFSLGIESADNQDIPLDVVIGTLQRLKEEGYPIYMITWDSFQSAMIKQTLNRKRIDNEYLSVDITKEPYLFLKRLMLSNRFIGVNNSVAKQEAKRLLNLERKIDHPNDGSKDIMDGITGSIYECYRNLDTLLAHTQRTKYVSSNRLNRQMERLGFKRV